MNDVEQVKQTTNSTLHLCAVCGDQLSGGLDTFTQVSIVDGAQQFDIMCSHHFWSGWKYCNKCDDFTPSNSAGMCSLCSAWKRVEARRVQFNQKVLGVTR